MSKEFKIKYLKSNNTITIYKKNTKNMWQWWYEIDMDDISFDRLCEWKNHLLTTKTWINNNPYILDKINEIYHEKLFNK